MGDINFDFLKHPPKQWLDCLETFNISQLITQPTRVTENSSTLIDHIYTNKPKNITEINVRFFSLSAHYPVVQHENALGRNVNINILQLITETSKSLTRKNL